MRAVVAHGEEERFVVLFSEFVDGPVGDLSVAEVAVWNIPGAPVERLAAFFGGVAVRGHAVEW